MYYVNPQVKDLFRIFDQNERSEYLRLDLNENPGGLPEDFVRDVLGGVTPQLVAEYPETRRFSEVLAKHLGTDSSHLCVTNGSAEAIRYVIEAFTSPGGRIVGVSPSYFMFQVYSEMYGREFIPVPYKSDLSMDVSDIINQITPETQLLVLLNPNNPMGNVYTDEEFEELIEAADKAEVTVLVDEAYHYFYPKTFIKYALTRQHVLVTRTFSKLFSMAGCRLGYVAGWPDGVGMVQRLCTPHNTNAFALRFAEAILETPGMVDHLVESFTDGREWLLNELDRLEYPHKGEAGNFIFIEPRTDADAVVRQMKDDHGILIKSYHDVGCFGDCLRVTIGERRFMEEFVKALVEVDR